MPELVVAAQHRGEQPGADDVVRLGAQVHRERDVEQVGLLPPTACDERGERRGGPGVHDVGIADEAAGSATLVLGVARRALGLRVDREVRLVGQDRIRVVDGPLVVEAVPDGERHPEVALARDQPVAVEALHPVVVAVPHVVGVPAELGAPSDEVGLELVRTPAVADVPLA